MNIISISLEQSYLPGKPLLPLLAACEHSPEGKLLRACVSDHLELFEQSARSCSSVDMLAEKLGLAILDFSLPWRLQPVHIAKPWGQEIWYTGIEARGVSRVVSASGSTPLDWAIAVAREQVLGNHLTPNLLKILDPLPDEVYGDLYFELHEEKREVYVVTHVDDRAWPDGTGAIRFGFCAQKRAQYANDDAFLAAYRAAVNDYRHVRCALDGQMDALRERDGFSRHEPVSAQQTRRWLAELPQDLQTQEATLRAQMDGFTGIKPLRVGDVLAVPLRTPHALQHGVRTVEFQTPVYERKILSFAQKVLTQEHWDTDEALELAQLQLPETAAFPVLHDADAVKIERIVQFDDFSVLRIYLEPQAQWRIERSGDYRLLMVVQGAVQCGDLSLQAEEAVLLPAALQTAVLHNAGDTQAVVLLAMPSGN